MKILKFTLSGETAFFKQPDVNEKVYFTFNNIHKVALMGMFGAILGYDGYNQHSFIDSHGKDFNISNNLNIFPEFYNKLKYIEIAIIPRKYVFDKKIQTYNNSVGYASKQTGNNLIIREQWLQNASWDIYIKSEDNKDLVDALLSSRYVYIPYLGKNDHIANISNVELIDANICDSEKIDSIFIKSNFNIKPNKKSPFDNSDKNEIINKYEEYLPITLDEEFCQYQYEKFIMTNALLEKCKDIKIYNVKNKNIVFF